MPRTSLLRPVMAMGYVHAVAEDRSRPVQADLPDLYRAYAPLLHARARRIVGDEAEDVVQEVFARLLRAPPAAEVMVAWMYRTSTNLCLDRLRHRARRAGAWEAELQSFVLAQGPREVEALVRDRELCRKLLARMDARTQQIAVLVYFDEMGVEEAARILGLSRKTVAERLQRFTDKARKLVSRWLS